MSFTIFNGSPRNKKSNSAILAQEFLKGFAAASTETFELHHLASLRHKSEQLEAFGKASVILFIFPLYTDSMPAIVKAFFEKLYESGFPGPKKVGYIVQSGFKESIHSLALAAYLEKFTRRLGYDYLGTVIKGGVEGIQIMPPRMTKKLFADFYRLGLYFGKHTAFDPQLMAKMAKPYRLSKASQWMMKFAPSFMINFYWNMNLRKHKAFNQRFDQPFKP